mmetsp:Transcript_56368/g.123516  ORF Transcript_56368/g.123516 Transcript_56368/m.123516 type:complete len:204 (+) Transcript_56368:1286-1897(+)
MRVQRLPLVGFLHLLCAEAQISLYDAHGHIRRRQLIGEGLAPGGIGLQRQGAILGRGLSLGAVLAQQLVHEPTRRRWGQRRAGQLRWGRSLTQQFVQALGIGLVQEQCPGGVHVAPGNLELVPILVALFSGHQPQGYPPRYSGGPELLRALVLFFHVNPPAFLQEIVQDNELVTVQGGIVACPPRVVASPAAALVIAETQLLH